MQKRQSTRAGSSKPATNKNHQSVVAHGSEGASTSTSHDSKTRLPGISGKGNSLSEKYTNKLLNISTYLFSTVQLWKTKPMNSQDYDNVKPDVKESKSETDKYTLRVQTRQQPQQQQQKLNSGNGGGGTNSEYFINYSAEYSQQRRSKDNKITTGNSSNNHSSDANIVKPTIGKQQSRNSRSNEPFDDSQALSAIDRFRVRSISDGSTVRRPLSERQIFSGVPDSPQSIPTQSSGHSNMVPTRDNRTSRSTSQSPQITASHHLGTSAPSSVLCCDKCDGKHATDECPYYKKAREQHPDAQKRSANEMGCVSTLPGSVLRNCRVIRQPGDGSCLFHSMAYGLSRRSTAGQLRAEICYFIQSNPDFKISDTPLQDWVKWDTGTSVTEYSRKMSRGSWGGGIEMACLSQLKDCNVHVYERTGPQYKRISAFDHPVDPEKKPVIRVLYCGGVHYDAIEIT